MEKSLLNNKIEEALENRFPKGFHILPKNDFFVKIGIRRKRWGMIFRNEKAATLEEIGKVSKYFDIPVNMLIDDDSLKQ